MSMPCFLPVAADGRPAMVRPKWPRFKRWLQRWQDRRALLQLDPEQMREAGLNPYDMRDEALRPFWRP